jgi:hypothetical protein
MSYAGISVCTLCAVGDGNWGDMETGVEFHALLSNDYVHDLLPSGRFSEW